VRGTAVFLHPAADTTPLALRANVEFNHTLHRAVVILGLRTESVPYVRDERLEVDDLGYKHDGITLITARYGFQEAPDVPALLRRAAKRGLERRPDIEGASYFISRITILPTDQPGMARWRKKLFTAMAKNASSPIDYFRLPVDRVVTMGSQIEL
jgi:KUP system potassium uptake protein